MDPVTAFLNCTAEVSKMITAIVEGQTPEQKAKLWDWFVADQERIRKHLHIGE